MSDQEVKPVEAVEAPVEAPATEVTTETPAVGEKAETTNDDTKVAETAESKTKTSAIQAPEGMLRVSGRKFADDKVFRNNVKFDPSTLPETDDPKQIRTQVEFYFSNSNLPTDKFLFELVGGAENKAVPVKQISSFKRMKRFQPYSAVVNALKESNTLVVEGEEGEETVRRKTPFDPSKQSQAEEQSIYAKGFGDETPTAQVDIEQFFTQYGEINSVRLRRADNRSFKGSVFVEWADKETAEKFLALDPKPQWKEHPLLIMSKKEYVDQKNEDIREGRVDPHNSKARGGARGSARGGRGGRGGRSGDSDDWKKRRDQDQRNGFKDRRGGKNDRGRGRGRGGNRGRGGRDRQDGGRDGAAREPEQRDNRDVGRPKINISGDGEKENGKRSRDTEGHGDEPAAKKVDNKETV